MTARDRLRRARLHLMGVVMFTALLWAVAVGAILTCIGTLASRAAPLSTAAIQLMMGAIGAAALAAASAVLWRARGARSLESVALWIEERDPRLQYALVTAIERENAPRALCDVADKADIEGHVLASARTGLGRGAIAVGLAIPVLLASQPADLLRSGGGTLRRTFVPSTPQSANRIAAFTVRVAPPSYSRLAPSTLRQPSSVRSLIGSRLDVQGAGAPDGITASVVAAHYRASGEDERWSVALTMDSVPAVLSLSDREFRVLIALEPVPDSAPVVRLREPARDTVYHVVPRTPIDIAADVDDDVGVNYGYVEYMISTGAEESFDTKVVNGPRVSFANARRGSVRARLALDTMKLVPGSFLHVRVVALDFNDVTGPGRGVSETRTIRIAEPVDSTSVVAAPPQQIDSMWVSQRLLNMRTDTLIRTKLRLSRNTFVSTSSVYGNTQDDIRQRALAIIDLLEDNGAEGREETDISRKLRKAADLMWTAREGLGIARPDTAMPVMVRILAILDEIRLANRYHFRGVLPPVPVDIARARLTGTGAASVGDRAARERLREARVALARRLENLVTLSRTAPTAAADSLVYVRLKALTVAPTAAASLSLAIDALRAGRNASADLVRARRALGSPAVALRGPLEWGGVLP